MKPHTPSITAPLALVLAFLTSMAMGATFTVSNNNDSGAGSLRDAITNANLSTGPHTITITAKGIILLQTPLPPLNQNMTINGSGASFLTVRRDPSKAFLAAIFKIGNASTPTVTLSGMGIAGNDTVGVEVDAGNVTIQDCVIHHNRDIPGAGKGGGIHNANGSTVTVLRTTIAFNESKDRGAGIYAQGGVKVIDSTISGNSIFQEGDETGQFLTFKGANVATNQDALDYYSTVDPQNLRTTLGDWWKANGFSKTDGSAPNATKVAYLNHNDLGFGRDMHMAQNGSVVSSWVANYSLTAPKPDQNPLSADAALAQEPSQAIATVCMEYSAVEGDTRPFVKFFVYAGVGPGAARVNSADLDGRGEKFVPQLCTTCHGGTVATGAKPTITDLVNAPSSFREFDIASFKFARPGTRADDSSRSVPTAAEQVAFKALNNMVRNSNPAAGIKQLIEGWYAPSMSRSTQDTAFVPPGWKDANKPADNTLPNFYLNVVAKSCRTCHVAFEPFRNFSDFPGFYNYRSTTDAFVFGSATKFMPHASVTFKNFWNEGVADKLAKFAYKLDNNTDWQMLYPGGFPGIPGVGGGAGIEVVGGAGIEISASTIAFNTIHAGANVAVASDATNGAGLRVDVNQTATIRSSIIANNFVNVAGYSLNDLKVNVIGGVGSGTLTSQGFNLIGTLNGIGGTLGGTTASNIVNVDPQLGPLLYHSADINPLATLTLELLANSPAINKGDNSILLSPLNLSVDQRGQPRKFGSSVDIGAFESSANVASGNGARDINSDGYADLCFQNKYGQIAAWYMDGKGNNTGGVYLSTANLGDWRLKCVADMNGDGRADLIFQNNYGQIAVWHMNGSGGIASSAYIYAGGLGDWRVMGAGDMNGDGKADLIFQNNYGQVVAWSMDGSGHNTGGYYIYGGGLGDWKVAAVADMNGDGKTDLIFQNNYGQIVVWYMNGSGGISSSLYVYSGGLGPWRVRCAADMDGDGTPDILLQDNYGRVVVWYMNSNGTVRLGSYIFGGILGDWVLR